MEINIATAQITGLEEVPYYFEYRDYYAWNIMFKKSSTLKFSNLPFIKVGDTEEEGKITCSQIKENFKKANIHESDKVAIIFDNDTNIIAISRSGQDSWIDVTDKFKNKTFSELNIDITSLKVY